MYELERMMFRQRHSENWSDLLIFMVYVWRQVYENKGSVSRNVVQTGLLILDAAAQESGNFVIHVLFLQFLKP